MLLQHGQGDSAWVWWSQGGVVPKLHAQAIHGPSIMRQQVLPCGILPSGSLCGCFHKTW